MLVLKVRIDLFFVVFGAVALEVLLYAVLISIFVNDLACLRMNTQIKSIIPKNEHHEKNLVSLSALLCFFL